MSELSSPVNPELKRSLSLLLISFYGIGTILGAGIYVLVGKVAGVAGYYTPVAFLLASVLAASSAFSYAELSSRFPKSAGEAIYIQQGFNVRGLSIFTGLLIAIIGMVSTATLIHGFMGYLNVFVNTSYTPTVIVVMLLLGVIVSWGIKQSVILAGIITLIEISGLFIIIWVARDSLSKLPAFLPTMIPDASMFTWAGILMGSFIAFYAFIGFEDIVNVAEEVQNPVKNLPRAIIISLVITTLLYFMVATMSVLAMPPEKLAVSDAPLAELYMHITGKPATVITLIGLLSVLNGALVQVIMASRILYGMSKRAWLPGCFGYVNPKTGTPLISTFTVIIIILLLILMLPLLSLAKITSFITLTVFAIVNLALLRVKISTPDTPGICIPFIVPVMGFILSSCFVIYQFIQYLINA